MNQIPNIEELIEQLFQYYDDIDCAVTVNQRITAKEQAELWLTRVITEAHQAGIDEAVELVNKHDPMANKKSNPNYWGNTLRKDLKALQDKE